MKAFWDERAENRTLVPAQRTHLDVWQRWLEIETIKPLLRRSDRVLDVGSGSGYATKQLAPFVSSIKGIDFSEPMIKRAEDDGRVPKNASFEVGDVLDLSPETHGLFDVVLSLRCLINLPDWSTQQVAIENIASVLKRRGRFIFVEGCKDGRDGLNRARARLGLKTMPPVWHNVDFERERSLRVLTRRFKLVSELGFGLYDLIARIVHPMLVAPDEPRYDARINEIAARVASSMQGCEGISRVLFLVLERK